MPRRARELSQSGYYHVIKRGNGKQILFEDDSDRLFYLEYLSKCLKEEGVALIAWCLMDNHIHLVVHDSHDHLSSAMARVNTTYAIRFNEKTQHVGHVFQGRYQRVSLETEPQLLEAVRYVHNNPPKANICRAEDYEWSSYREYIGEKRYCDTSLVLYLVGGSENFELFCKQGIDPSVMLAYTTRPSSDDLLDIARETLAPTDPNRLKALPKAKRDAGIRKLKRTGFSVRQIQRMTGIGRNIIQRVGLDE